MKRLTKVLSFAASLLVSVAAGYQTAFAVDNPDAILSSPDHLLADTIDAAQHDRTESKIAYIGAWASDARGCGQIDQDVYDGFVIVTPTQVRSFEEICEIKAAPMQSNPTTLNAMCSAEGETYESKFIIEMVRGGEMKFKHEGTSGFNLIRCQLPR